ncbi:energy transducer TonB [Rhodocista pekingensis]|uniref:Protein TonB n=1 Tax=Rhodocista pekingensis TaxID=201185 RepID=A0ABW2KQS0_9PROT
MIARYATALLAAILVTLALFWLMQYLIIGQTAKLDESARVKLIDFVRLQRDTQTETKERKPPDRPPPPETPPEPPKMSADPTAAPSGNAVNIDPGALNTGLDIAGPGAMAVADAEAIPLFRMAPQYPERAASRGIEGYVVMEFTINETGGVENIKVIEANPPGYFERSAVKAMEKWKYKPKIVDGKPVKRHGVQNKLTFELQK